MDISPFLHASPRIECAPKQDTEMSTNEGPPSVNTNIRAENRHIEKDGTHRSILDQFRKTKHVTFQACPEVMCFAVDQHESHEVGNNKCSKPIVTKPPSRNSAQLYFANITSF